LNKRSKGLPYDSTVLDIPTSYDWDQCCKHQVGEYVTKGPKKNLSATSENINKLKKTQIIYFQFLKNLKQQHQINALPHKYKKKTDK